MGDLEKFIHGQPVALPPLIKAALMHVQFETIHPFLDGNGRIGRLLITLLLQAEGILSQPLLYLSLFFKQHRSYYYDLLQAIRDQGDWEEWLAFFLEGVIAVSNHAASTTKRLLAISAEHQSMARGLGRQATSALRTLEYLQRHPVTTATAMATATGMSFHTAQRTLATLQPMGIVTEGTGKKYGKIFTYTDYLAILNEEITL
jgi:Fic family protein